MEAGFMINIIKKHTFSSDEYRKEELSYFNLDQLFQYFSHDDFTLSIENKKKKFLNKFVDNLLFVPENFRKIDIRIAFLFKSNIVKI